MDKVKLASALRLVRPVNSTMMGFAVLIGAFLTPWRALEWDALLNLPLGFATGFALTAASMALNDYVDREIDAVNQPRRPIPSGAISPREAVLWGTAWSLLGFAAAAATGPATLLTAIIAWLLFTSYTIKGKRVGFPGNLLVSGCVVTPFFYGALLLNNTIGLNTLLFASMAFLANTGREVTKGIPDAAGDAVEGVKTIAATRGALTASAVAVSLYATAVLLTPLPWILGTVSAPYLPVVTMADVGFLQSSVSLIRDPSPGKASNVKSRVLIWMLLGLLAFLLGGLG